MNKEIWKDPQAYTELEEAEVPLWFWNDKLETDELNRQMDLMASVGVTASNPHARRNGGEGYIGDYLGEGWFRDMKTVVDYKKAHNEKLWLYDEIDWPAGTRDQTIPRDENYREQFVTIEKVVIPAGELFHGQTRRFEGETPTSGIMLDPTTDLAAKDAPALNITIVDSETLEEIDLSKYVKYTMFGPEIVFQAERECTAYLYRVNADLYEYDGNEQVSYINAEATRAFLKSTYDLYYEHFADSFGKEITTVFNDETRMCHAIVWSRDFARTFEERWGYDVRKKMYCLMLPGEAKGGEAGRVKMHYLDTVAYMYQQNYFGELYKWCKAHDLKFFAHLLGEETLMGHARYSGDYLRQYRMMDVGGADHLGKGIGSLNIKFTSAAAHSYGLPQTAVEVFAGCGWDMTFDEYTRICTWMFQQGMQTIINHGFFYSDRGARKNDWPPSQFFQWQGWPRQKDGNAMIRRLHYAMTGGINEENVLVYLPIESFWRHYIPDPQFTHAFGYGALTKDARAAEIDRETQLLLNHLQSENISYDMIHQDATENFAVCKTTYPYEKDFRPASGISPAEDGAAPIILNKKSGQQFSVLILPFCEVLPLEAAQLARDFAQAGGKVIVIDAMPQFGMRAEEDAAVRECMTQINKSGHLVALVPEEKDALDMTLRETIPQPVRITQGTARTTNNHPCYPDYLIDPYLHDGEDLSGVLFTRYLKDGERNTLFMNYGSEPETIHAFIATEGGVPEVCDTMTGEVREAQVIRRQEAGENGQQAGYEIELTLPCNYGILVVSKA